MHRNHHLLLRASSLSKALIFGLVLAATCATSVSTGQEWTRFRGPNGSGISNATTVPTSWSADDYNWVVDLPGIGHSSPVTWGDSIYLTGSDEAAGKRYLLCLDANTGKTSWQVPFDFGKHKKHKTNSFATGTPACDAEHVYISWQSTNESYLYAFDHTGNEVWKYDLGDFKGGHGPAASPIVFQDMVIFCHDHEGDSYRVAIDRNTGKELWKLNRPGVRACYATPCIYETKDGNTEIICTHSYEGITSINPKTGAINWDIKPFGEFKQRAIGSPIVVGDLVFGTSGFTQSERNVVAVRPGKENGKTTGVEAFRVTRGAPHIPTPIAHNGLLFLWDDKGIITCVKANDGTKVYQKRIGGTFFGSPVCVNGYLYCMDRDGVVVVLKAGDTYEEIARVELGQPTVSTPAISGGVMYLRTESKLFSLGG